jgi:hypothetical protein
MGLPPVTTGNFHISGKIIMNNAGKFLEWLCYTFENKPLPPYYKTWSNVSLGLNLMLSLLLAKKMTVTASVLSQE